MRSHYGNGLAVSTDPDGTRWVRKQKVKINKDEVAITLAVCDGSRGLPRASEDADSLKISQVGGAELYNGAKRFSESRDLARVFADYAAALAHVHACGYAHRDLNCGNLLLTSKCAHGARGVLVDFGIAVPVDLERSVDGPIALDIDEYTNEDWFFGRYPPEFVFACEMCDEFDTSTDFDARLRSYAKQLPELADPAIDVYGLGRVLEWVLDKSQVDACDPDGAARLKDIAADCCAKEPGDRPPAAEVRDRLDSLWL